MAEAQTNDALLPAAPFLTIPADGKPYLAGVKCKTCGATYAAQKRIGCAKCGERKNLESVKLSDSGKLYNYTIVYRSFPGVKVPFVSAIVDLDGGGTIKGNLVDVDLSKPENVKFDMPVKVVYRDAERKDAQGRSYLSYFFVPA
ncbi:MAG: Zn-ribbon domain-containing OB-fold protein [Caulobacterales bacterium]